MAQMCECIVRSEKKKKNGAKIIKATVITQK